MAFIFHPGALRSFFTAPESAIAFQPAVVHFTERVFGIPSGNDLGSRAPEHMRGNSDDRLVAIRWFYSHKLDGASCKRSASQVQYLEAAHVSISFMESKRLSNLNCVHPAVAVLLHDLHEEAVDEMPSLPQELKSRIVPPGPPRRMDM